MKKSVLLMAGLLAMAMALAGSAQAATMFAVQNSSGTQDMAAISDTGDITANKIAMGLANAPGSVALTAGTGPYHLASAGSNFLTASGVMQHVAFPTTVGGATYATSNAPNFAFYRVNKNDSTGVFSLPTANAALGYLNFGIVDWTLDPSTPAYKKNLAQMWARAEAATATNPNAWTAITNTPTFIHFMTTHWTGSANSLTEKMRISSDGSVGIGTLAPTSKLHVVGLPVFADNTAALAGGLTAGAFYRTATGVLMVAF